MACSDDARLKSEEVAESFWNENKAGISEEGKTLIRELNKATPTIKGVRYEEMGPHIYGVKVNSPKLVIETFDGTEQKMTLVKVGLTQTDTGIKTSMADIKRDIKKSWGIEVACWAIFALPIYALDTRVFSGVKAEVRSKVGIKVPKKIGKALQLPVHTEWVVTTEEFITRILNKIEPPKPEKQQEVKPEEEQSTGKGDQSTPKSSKQKHATEIPASASSVMPDRSTPRIKQEDVESLSEATDGLTLNTKALSPPGGAEATPGKDETPLKNQKPAKIDTDAIFGKDGLEFNKGDFDKVQCAFDYIKDYKISEVNAVKITESNGELNLKLMKSKKNQSI